MQVLATLLADVHQVFAREGRTTYDAVGHNVGSVVTSRARRSNMKALSGARLIVTAVRDPLGCLRCPTKQRQGWLLTG